MELKNTDRNEVAISVIIPCFNHGEFLVDAIASVETCRSDLYEIIIVNDGSKDPLTLRVLSNLKSAGYRVIDQPNQGQSVARNTGISAAKGRYILPVDADNKVRPDMLYEGIKVLDAASDIGVVYGDVRFFSDEGNVRTFPIQAGYGYQETINEREWIWRLPDFDLNKLVITCYLDACAVFRKSVWAECGGYDTNMPFKGGCEDWELWLNMASRGWQFHHVPQVLHDYRFDPESETKEWNEPDKRRILVEHVKKKYPFLFLRAKLLKELSRGFNRIKSHLG